MKGGMTPSLLNDGTGISQQYMGSNSYAKAWHGLATVCQWAVPRAATALSTLERRSVAWRNPHILYAPLNRTWPPCAAVECDSELIYFAAAGIRSPLLRL